MSGLASVPSIVLTNEQDGNSNATSETPLSADISTAHVPSLLKTKNDDRRPFHQRMQSISAEEVDKDRSEPSPTSIYSDTGSDEFESELKASDARSDRESEFDSEEDDTNGEKINDEDEEEEAPKAFSGLKLNGDKIQKTASSRDTEHSGDYQTNKAKTSFLSVKQGSSHKNEVPQNKQKDASEIKRDFFSKLKRLGEKFGSQELTRTTSLDSIVNPKGVKPKSILKKSTSQIKIDEPQRELVPSHSISSSDIADITSLPSTPVTPTAQTTEIKQEISGETSLARVAILKSANNNMHSSAPNLQTYMTSSSDDLTGGMRKSASKKYLVFNLENTQVLPVLSKTAYNRKPDNNMTFKKLTPKLKDEIRAELNDFKKNEMLIHQDSAHNTVFHY